MTPGGNNRNVWKRVIKKDPYLSHLKDIEADLRKLPLRGKDAYRKSDIVGAKFDSISLKDLLGRKGMLEERYSIPTRLGIVCADMVIKDAKITEVPKDTIVVIGNARGNTAALEDMLFEVKRCISSGEDYSELKHVRGISITSASTIASSISRFCGLVGFTGMVGSACTSALSAIKIAFDAIRSGQSTTAITGGIEAALNVLTCYWFCMAGTYAKTKGDPTDAVRPFSTERTGTALSEMGCVLLLEEEKRALERGAKIYGEILAVSTGIETGLFNYEAMSPEGKDYGRLIDKTIKAAGILPSEIGLVAAHAPGTVGDSIELRALGHVFGDNHPPTVSFKSVIGHGIGGCGAAETALALYAMEDSVIPPNSNITPETTEIVVPGQNIPTEAESKEISYVLKTGSGFGGYLGAMVIKKYE
jgi:3-oxoacyl-[acyl-carrier-protein] synthase II